MDICEVCRGNLADFVCLCSTPFLRVCNMCVGAHVTKPSRTSHSLEPIACKQFLKGPEDIPRYRARQHAVRLADSALDQNFERLEAYKTSLQSLTTIVNTWLTEKLTQLGQVETRIRTDITACKEKTVELMRTAIPPIDSKLVAVVLGPECGDEGKISGELTLFQGKTIEETDIRSTLDGVCQLQVYQSPLQQSPSASSPSPSPTITPSKNSADGLSAILSHLEQVIAQNENKLKEKEQIIAQNEKKLSERKARIKALEQEVRDAQTDRLKLQEERSKRQTELQQTAQSLVPTQQGLEQKVEVSQTPLSQSYVRQEVHPRVWCDGCEQKPLQGPRWKCQICPSFDFCQNCYGFRPHPPGHQFKRVQPST